MAKIKVMAECPLYDGMPVTFQAPCDCAAVDGLRVCYDGTNKDFGFRDAHGNDLAGIGNLFAEGAYVKAILNTTDGAAYIQNADTNAYIEGELASKYSLSEMEIIPSGADLNDYITPGSYRCQSATIAGSLSNCPFTIGGFVLHVVWTSSATKGRYVRQTIIANDTDMRNFERSYMAGEFYDWATVYTTSNKPTATEIGAEPSFDVLPIAKGGTGGSDVIAARNKLGIGTHSGRISASGSGSIALPKNGVYIICASTNVHRGALLVFTGNSGIRNVVELLAPVGFSYSNSTSSLTLTATDTASTTLDLYVTSIRNTVYEG